ncbi:MAG: hypothetical protein ACREIA_06065 [Opitutaceae bacterium]
MKQHIKLILSSLAVTAAPFAAPGQVALLAESSRSAPSVEEVRQEQEAEEEGKPLVLVVDEKQDLNPSVIASAAYQSKAELFDAPPAGSDEVILLPEFVVRGDAVDPQREAMMERLSDDIRRLESAGFDPVRGGKLVVQNFGDARLTVGNDAERPEFSLLSLEW